VWNAADPISNAADGETDRLWGGSVGRCAANNCAAKNAIVRRTTGQFPRLVWEGSLLVGAGQDHHLAWVFRSRILICSSCS